MLTALQLLMPCGISETYHEMIVARLSVSGNFDILLNLIGLASCGNGVVVVENPHIGSSILHRIQLTIAGIGTVGMVIEIVMDFNVVITQLYIILEDIAHGYFRAPVRKSDS